MDSDGVGKIRPKRSQAGSKPYERKPSLLKRFGSSVRDLLMPSWLGGVSVNDNEVNKTTDTHSRTIPSSSEDRYAVSQQSGQDSNHIFKPDSSKMPNQPISSLDQHKSWFSPGSSGQSSLTREEQTKLRMSDSFVNDRNSSAMQSVSVRPITVSTGSFNKSITASKKQKLWSPEIARAGKPLVPPATEKPSFNSTLLGGLDKSETFFGDSFRESSFYSGKTRYGGAAAERKSQAMNKSLPYQTSLPLRKQVKANQMNKSFQAVTSVTAQRIMDTLDKMSTPLGDAKKIPRADTSNDSILSFTPSSYRRTSLLGASRSATRPLQLPKGPPTSRYQIVGKTEASINRNRPSGTEKKDSSSAKSGSSFISQEQISLKERDHVSAPTVSTVASGSGKMKTKKFSSHISSKVDEEEVLQVPNLQTDFTLPMSSMKPITLSSISKTKSNVLPSNTSSLLTDVSPLKFTFSTPIQKTQANMNSLTPQDKDYTFSTPIQPAKTSAAGAEEGSKLSPEPAVGASSATGHFTTPAFSPTFTPVWGSTSARPKVKASSPDIGGTSSSFSSYSKWGSKDSNEVSAASESPGGFMSPSTNLKKGSVMDILGGAIKSTKSSIEATSKNENEDLFAKFQKPTGVWDCDICLLQNKADALKCIACEAPKPGAQKTVPTAKPGASIPISDDLLAKFKQPSGSWECDICMLSNKPEVPKCVACEAPKPGQVSQTAPQQTVKSLNNNSLPAMFKQPPGNWECDTCMIQNTATALKCIACESSKPGLQSAGVVSKVVPNGPASAMKICPGGGFSFDLPSATTTTSEGSGGFKFGNTVAKPSNPSAPTSGFVFGGNSEGAKEKNISESSSGGFPFCSSPSTASSSNVKTSQPSSGFVFGGASNSPKDSQMPTGFQFGTVVSQVSLNSVKPVSSNPIVTVGSENSKTSTVTSAFQFGGSLNSDKSGKSDLEKNQPASASFSFSAQPSIPKTTVSTSFNFSQPTTTNATSASVAKPSTSLFSFGGTTPQVTPVSSAGLGTGSSLTISKPSAPVPALMNGGFGCPLDQKPGSNAADGLKSGFNGSAAATVFSFGQPGQSNSINADTTTSNKRSVDFSNTDHSPAKKSGTGQPNGLFAFGGHGNSSNTAPSGGFGGFGAASSAVPAPAPSGGFAFGSATSFGQTVAPPAAPPAFGTNPVQQGGFNFSMASAPNFNFGSTSLPTVPSQSGPSPFQFGGNKNDNAAPASNSGLFQFNAPSTTPAPAFAAAPAVPGGFSIGSGETARRPIKKAIRKIRR